MKIVTVVGARPQFIKAAVVSNELRKKHTEILVHTGQHYDYNMSAVFFEELGIPKPDYNLGISGGSHAEMTGRMMISVEEVLLKEKPDWLLVYGDTNSTLAAAIASAKLHIPVCHVEAGARTHNLENPEEINRVCTDHISSLLLASTRASLDEMKRENLYHKGFFVGDPMYDAYLKYSEMRNVREIVLSSLDGEAVCVPDQYYYMTCHREENTSDDDSLTEIFKAMSSLDAPTIYPVHPRNKDRALRIKKKGNFESIYLTEPVGYLESIALVKNAKKVVTDSGGLQREAFFAGIQCVTVLDFVVWPETMVDNRNQLAKPNSSDIQDKLSRVQTVNKDYKPFGDGKSAVKIVNELEKCCDSRNR